MKRNRIFVAMGVVVSLTILTLWSTQSYGGGAIRGARTTEIIEAQIGIRCSGPISENMKVGSIVNGTVIQTEKLQKFGFKNVKRGDKVRLRLIDEGGKFEVEHANGRMNFLMEDKGNIKLVK